MQGPIEIDVKIAIISGEEEGRREGVVTIGMGMSHYPTETEIRERVAKFIAEEMPEGFRVMDKLEYFNKMIRDLTGSRERFAIPGGPEWDTAATRPIGSIDRKFHIDATNPVNGKQYDENNSLLLCAKDAAVPAGLIAYRDKCEQLGAAPEHIASIQLLIGRVVEFQAAAGGGRIPDTIGAELPRCLEGIE